MITLGWGYLYVKGNANRMKNDLLNNLPQRPIILQPKFLTVSVLSSFG